jgi:hypothetical protein
MRAMRQRWLVAAALITGCGTEPDPREPTFEVVAVEVLRPSCGQVQCHSLTTRTEGLSYAFDTVETSRSALGDMGVFADPSNNILISVLDGNGRPRMPFDAPLNDEDRALIDRWLADGAPGL